MALLQVLLSALIAFVGTSWVHPYILKIARSKNIVDNPDARKLQRIPVPVLGGISVVFGILVGAVCFNLYGNFNDMLPVLVAMTLIMVVGMIDDIIELSPRIRFIIEIVLVSIIIYTTHDHINNINGLWGLEIIPNSISIPLTIFACVGIINAVNLIDGVDGYSSGYCVTACALFGAMFYHLGNITMVAMAAMVAVALIPFFLHNVFGKYSKMFIRDSGTLAMGVILSSFVTTLLSTGTDTSSLDSNLGMIPFTLAVMCVPVFDTLRVMSARIVRHQSPFYPDKTHLHHLFIDLGFSHIGTTFSIICMNLLVVILWFVSYKLGASVDLQLYIVIGLGLLITFVFYGLMRRQMRKNGAMCKFMCYMGKISHIERTGVWAQVQNGLDKNAPK